MVNIEDNKIVGTKQDMIEFLSAAISFLNDKPKTDKIKELLEEVENHIGDNVKIMLSETGDKFNVVD